MIEFKLHPSDYGFKLQGEIILLERCISKSNSKSRWLEKRFKEFEDRIIIAAQKSKIGKGKSDFGWIVLQCYYKNKKYVDINNSFKSVADGLVKAKIFEDDKNVAITGLPVIVGKEDKTIIQIWR